MTTPLMINLANRKCLLIGAGNIGSKRARFLLGEEADVTIWSKALHPSLDDFKEQFQWINKDILLTHLNDVQLPSSEHYFLVVIATNNKELNQQLAQHFQSHTPLINVVDNHKLSNFYFPAYVKRGLLRIGISTSGASPILAKKIKKHFDEVFHEDYIDYLNTLHQERENLLKTESDPKVRYTSLAQITPFPLKNNKK